MKTNDVLCLIALRVTAAAFCVCLENCSAGSGTTTVPQSSSSSSAQSRGAERLTQSVSSSNDSGTMDVAALPEIGVVPDVASTRLDLPYPTTVPYAFVNGTIPQVQLAAQGPIFSFPGTWHKNHTVTVDIPVNMLVSGGIPSIYMPTTPTESFGGVTLVNEHWQVGVNASPDQKTIVFVHGIASSVQDSFSDSTGCAGNIVQAGGYQQAIGFDYDWSLPLRTNSQNLAALVASLGQQSQVDIEAHSLGTLVAIGAVPAIVASGTPIQNLVLLGGPLDGTPFAQPDFVQSFYESIILTTAEGFASPVQFDHLAFNVVSNITPNGAYIPRIENAVYKNATNTPARTLKVAGTQPLSYEDTGLWLFYDKDFSVKHAEASAAGTDGIIPITSALSANVPTSYTNQFPLNHTQLECASSVISWVAANLSAPNPYTGYTIPTANAGPTDIAKGPDGNLWFPEYNANKIGRVTATGSFSEYPIPTANSGPQDIVAGSDGALWFTESNAGNIGRITVSGGVTEYPVSNASSLHGITAGSDGALWFTNQFGNAIGRIAVTGTVSQYPLGTANSQPDAIAGGPDGALWFTEFATDRIGRITTSGIISEYPLPNANAGPYGIVAGSDGALWFTQYSANAIGRITTAGAITSYAIPTATSFPEGIRSGADGALWFTEQNGGNVGHLTTSGTIKEYPIPNGVGGGLDEGIVQGAGGIWITDTTTNQVGKLVEP
jgi:streptogramin lyase